MGLGTVAGACAGAGAGAGVGAGAGAGVGADPGGAWVTGVRVTKGWTGRRAFLIEMRMYGRLRRVSRKRDGKYEANL